MMATSVIKGYDCYKAGDTYTQNGWIAAPGFITNGGNNLYFSVFLDKPLLASGFTLTSLNCGVRLPSGGYLYYQDSSGNKSAVSDSSSGMYDSMYTGVRTPNILNITQICTKGYCNRSGAIQDNTPVTCWLKMSGTFT